MYAVVGEVGMCRIFELSSFTFKFKLWILSSALEVTTLLKFRLLFSLITLKYTWIKFNHVYLETCLNIGKFCKFNLEVAAEII